MKLLAATLEPNSERLIMRHEQRGSHKGQLFYNGQVRGKGLFRTSFTFACKGGSLKGFFKIPERGDRDHAL